MDSGDWLDDIDDSLDILCDDRELRESTAGDDYAYDSMSFLVWRETLRRAPGFFAAAPPRLLSALLDSMLAPGAGLYGEEIFLYCLKHAPVFWNRDGFCVGAKTDWAPGPAALRRLGEATTRHCPDGDATLEAKRTLRARGAPVGGLLDAMALMALEGPSTAMINHAWLYPLSGGAFGEEVPEPIREEIIGSFSLPVLQRARTRWASYNLPLAKPQEVERHRAWLLSRAEIYQQWAGPREAWIGAVIRAATAPAGGQSSPV